MSLFNKYLILVGIIGLIGIPMFVLNFDDLSWQANKESYWGMIAMVAIIVAQFALFFSSKREKKRNP